MTLQKELIIIRFDSENICMCFAEQVSFARLGARSVAPQRRTYARRAARRREQWTWCVHEVFTEPTGRKSVPARANRRRTRTRIALLTVHTRPVVFFARDIAPARLRHAYRVYVKSRPALKRGA